MRKVLIVTAPASQVENGDLEAMRGYILDSLSVGVLVIDTGTKWEVAELPELGGVEVAPAPDRGEGEGGPGDSCQPVFTGQGAKEKRRIYEALRQYRAREGLGCLGKLAERAGAEVSDTLLRAALQGEKLPMEIWRQIGDALDAVEVAGGETV